jgi:opacity protein-like surface antigen
MLQRFITGLLLLNLLSSGVAFAQRNANFGVFAGTAYYLGDINPNRHFYNPTLSLGALYRYNINTRYALRGNAYYTRLSGSDLDFPEILHPDRPYSPAGFNTSLLDLAIQVEFNFLPFTPNVGNWAYTPYIATGIAGGLILGSDVGTSNFLSFPLSAGLKVNLTSRISAGAEWSFRKTFSDNLDGLENPSGVYSILHNNDWYSVLGVFITFKFFNFAAKCPAYM